MYDTLRARLLHCRGAWLVMGLGPCGERAHLLAPVQRRRNKACAVPAARGGRILVCHGREGLAA